jgi:hypothetical protein
MEGDEGVTRPDAGASDIHDGSMQLQRSAWVVIFGKSETRAVL